MSFRELSCYGQEHYKTPNLDQLARAGVRFTQAYVGGCACSQSRGTLMTSLHTGHGPIRDNGSARGQEPLPDSCITIAEVLKEAGYFTGQLGKYGVGITEEQEGLFDVYEGTAYQGPSFRKYKGKKCTMPSG